MHITADSEMEVAARDAGAQPLVFMPQVDWDAFTEPAIIDAY
jgi:hypothetical protein